MEDLLSEEVIEEIMLRLPTKYAIRCCSLNKTFSNLISQPTFARQNAILSSSRQSPTILHLGLDASMIDPTVYYAKVGLEINEEHSISEIKLSTYAVILASCNGLLLLRTGLGTRPDLYVFNPITGGIVHVETDCWFFYYRDFGLAGPVKFHHFKLVELVAPWSDASTTTVLRFTVVAPSGDSTVVKSRVDFVCERFTRMEISKVVPVYLHGSLHWLGEHATKIVAFDVDKEKARLINGPFKKLDGQPPYFLKGANKWFGQAEGSLSFIYTWKHKIVVYKHDYHKDEWRIQYKLIDNICDTRNNSFRYGKVVLFYGKRLFVERSKGKLGGDIYKLELLSGKWEKKGIVERWYSASDHHQYCSYVFVPTLAKVCEHEQRIDKLQVNGDFGWDHFPRVLQRLLR